MSQTGSFERSASGITNVKTLTGNTGTTVPPNSQGDTKIVGSGNVSVSGDASLHTLTITASNSQDATTTQKGVLPLATDAETIAGVNSTKAVVPSGMKAKLGDQTNHAIPVAQGSTKKFEYKTLTDGQLLIGATGKDPKAAKLASSNASILFTTGENSLDLKTGSRVPTAVGVDAGGAAIPSGNKFNLLGGTHCSTSASGADVTIDVQVPTAQDATTTKKGVSRLSTNDEAKIGTAIGAIAVTPTSLKYKLGNQTNHGIAYGRGTGETIKWTAGLTDGQIVIGDTDGTPKAANVTSSNNTLSITKGSNTLDLKVSKTIPNKIVTNSGTAIPRENQMGMTGGKGMSTSALGENVIVKIDGTVADKFTGDAGTGAVPVGSILKLKGGTNCNTVATGDTVTINATGGGGGGGSQLTVDTDSGTAKSQNYVLSLKGGNLVNTSGSGKEVTFSLPNDVIAGISTDSGNLTPTNNSVEIDGGNYMRTKVVNRNRVVIDAGDGLVQSIRTNGLSVYGKNNSVNVTGGKGISTGQGSTDNDLVITNTEANSDLQFSDTKSPEGIAKPTSNKIEMHGDGGIDVTCSGNRARFSLTGGVQNPLKVFAYTDDGARGSATANASNQILFSGWHGITVEKSSDTPAGLPEWKGHGIDFQLNLDVVRAIGADSGANGNGSDLTPSNHKFSILGGRGATTRIDKQNLIVDVDEPGLTKFVVTTQSLVQASVGTFYLSNTAASEGATIQLPPSCKVGDEIAVTAVNSTYPGFEIFPGASQKIWVGDKSTTVTPSDGALSVARVKSKKRGDTIKLMCIVQNREWQAISKIGTFELQ